MDLVCAPKNRFVQILLLVRIIMHVVMHVSVLSFILYVPNANYFVYHYSGHDKQCLCSLAEEPYPALCAPVNSGGVRVAIGFYGMTRYLHT